MNMQWWSCLSSFMGLSVIIVIISFEGDDCKIFWNFIEIRIHEGSTTTNLIRRVAVVYIPLRSWVYREIATTFRDKRQSQSKQMGNLSGNGNTWPLHICIVIPLISQQRSRGRPRCVRIVDPRFDRGSFFYIGNRGWSSYERILSNLREISLPWVWGDGPGRTRTPPPPLPETLCAKRTFHADLPDVYQ
jgi:hypothetical protein